MFASARPVRATIGILPHIVIAEYGEDAEGRFNRADMRVEVRGTSGAAAHVVATQDHYVWLLGVDCRHERLHARCPQKRSRMYVGSKDQSGSVKGGGDASVTDDVAVDPDRAGLGIGVAGPRHERRCDEDDGCPRERYADRSEVYDVELHGRRFCNRWANRSSGMLHKAESPPDSYMRCCPVMLTVVFATSTAALFGCADFLGGLASRRDSAFIVTATAHTLGVVLLTAAAGVFPFEAVSWTDAMWGGIAGVAGGVGVAALYAGLAAGRMSVVAPITAALSGSLPAVYDLATGGGVGWLSGVGLALAVAAIVMVSMSSHADDAAGMPPRAIAFALLAGVGFAGSFISFSFTGSGSGLWPLVAARVVSATMLGGFALVRSRRVFVFRGVRRMTLGAGVLDTAANITMISAIRSGPLAVASVLGSLYPVVTVVLALGILRERVTPLQRLGVVVALAAVIMTAVG